MFREFGVMKSGRIYLRLKNFGSKLGIDVPVEKGQVIAPFGSVFWIKKEASRTILSRPWTYDEMPGRTSCPGRYIAAWD